MCCRRHQYITLLYYRDRLQAHARAHTHIFIYIYMIIITYNIMMIAEKHTHGTNQPIYIVLIFNIMINARAKSREKKRRMRLYTYSIIYNMHKIVKLYDYLCIHNIIYRTSFIHFFHPHCSLYIYTQPTETKTSIVQNNRRIYYRFIYDTASIPAR